MSRTSTGAPRSALITTSSRGLFQDSGDVSLTKLDEKGGILLTAAGMYAEARAGEVLREPKHDHHGHDHAHEHKTAPEPNPAPKAEPKPAPKVEPKPDLKVEPMPKVEPKPVP